MSSESIKPIGGYFEWEFPSLKTFTLHHNAVLLNSGRHALEYILRGLGEVACVYIPYYTCDAVVMPFMRLSIPYKFYQIDENLEIADDIYLGDKDYLIYTNYFGIKDAYVRRVVKQYGDKVIIDNAQALYCPPIARHQVYSPRKFIGMPDGGLAVTDVADYSIELPKAISFDKCSHLLKRVELAPSEGYNDFKAVSRMLAESSLSRMSVISEHILKSIDLWQIRKIRRENFCTLNRVLSQSNRLIIPELESFSCPLSYPFLTEDKYLKAQLIKEQVFVPTYWPNVLDWTKTGMVENNLANQLLAIPCDQRYGKADMERIVNIINK